jgi:hypothetical protein
MKRGGEKLTDWSRRTRLRRQQQAKQKLLVHRKWLDIIHQLIVGLYSIARSMTSQLITMSTPVVVAKFYNMLVKMVQKLSIRWNTVATQKTSARNT